MTTRHVNHDQKSAKYRLQNTTLGCLCDCILSERVFHESGRFRVTGIMKRERKPSIGTAEGDPNRVTYMHDMLHSMSGLAKGAGHHFLAYLITVAQQEAAQLARRRKS